MADAWQQGDRYDSFVGRWSRSVAPRFLDWLDVSESRRWMDVGCGTGALTSAILERCAPSAVTGVEPSAELAAWAGQHIDDDRATFVVADAEHLPAMVADVVVSGLVLNFVPDASAALAAMRAVAPGGTVAAYVWDYAGGMQMLRHFWDAAVTLDQAAAPLDEASRFPICDPERLAGLWDSAGFDDVTTAAIDVQTVFADFDDLWEPFLGGQGPAPGYTMSLDEQHRGALRERLRDGLPIESDGTIRLAARAWAVRGSVPVPHTQLPVPHTRL